MERETTRQRIADILRDRRATPTEIATELETTPSAVLDHARHLARSLRETDERLLVAPPTCRDCGFDRFDEPANLPSRCPACHSEAIEDPVLVIEAD